MATDDLSTRKPVMDKLGLERQVCVVRVRKNAARRMRKVKGWGEWKSRLRMPLGELPEDGGKRLMMMEREVRNEPGLRRLAVGLRACGAVRCATSACAARATRLNNVPERVIGGSKIRYKTLRGYIEYSGNDERALADAASMERVRHGHGRAVGHVA